MSATLATTRRNVRLKLRDIEPNGPYAFSGPEVDRAIIDSALKIGARIGMGLTWTTSGVTLTVGSTADYEVSTGTQKDRVVVARINATGDTLERVSFREINDAREGLVSSASGTGDPRRFALWENSGQQTMMRIDTVPSTARTIDFLLSAMQTATIADATSLPFSDLGLRAVEFDAAANLSAKAAPAVLERLGLGPQAAQSFMSNAAECVAEEKKRKANIAGRNYAVGRILGR